MDDRMERLERTVRELKLAVVAIGLLALIGIVASHPALMHAQIRAKPVKQIVRASTLYADQVQIMDKAGDMVGEWGPNPGAEGGTAIRFGETLRIVVDGTGQPSVHMTDKEGVPRLDIEVDRNNVAAVRVKDAEGNESKTIEARLPADR